MYKLYDYIKLGSISKVLDGGSIRILYFSLFYLRIYCSEKKILANLEEIFPRHNRKESLLSAGLNLRSHIGVLYIEKELKLIY